MLLGLRCPWPSCSGYYACDTLDGLERRSEEERSCCTFCGRDPRELEDSKSALDACTPPSNGLQSGEEEYAWDRARTAARELEQACDQARRALEPCAAPIATRRRLVDGDTVEEEASGSWKDQIQADEIVTNMMLDVQNLVAHTDSAQTFLHPCHYLLYQAHRLVIDAGVVAQTLRPTKQSQHSEKLGALRQSALHHCVEFTRCLSSPIMPRVSSWPTLYSVVTRGVQNGFVISLPRRQYSMEAASVFFNLGEFEFRETQRTAKLELERVAGLERASDAFSCALVHQDVCAGPKHAITTRTKAWILRLSVALDKIRSK